MIPFAGFVLWIAFAFLFLTGIGKLLDIEPFVDSLREWSALPAFAVPMIAYLVPAGEIWLAMRWWQGIDRRRTVLIAQLMLCSFTVIYLIEYFLRSAPPSCACLGLWGAYLGDLSSAQNVILRNLVLLAGISAADLVLGARVAGQQSVDRPANSLSLP
ncbi:MAG: hypothetical protein MUC36_10710 [Planctomycetes bacterium]|nr:hypothetical protein [Planctomycetota bacterium]